MVRRTKFTLVILMLLMSVLVSACGGSAVDAPPTTEMDTGSEAALDGKALLEQRCTKCHTLDRVERESKNAAGWGTNVREMVGKGAELNASEQQVLIEYLSITYP